MPHYGVFIINCDPVDLLINCQNNHNSEPSRTNGKLLRLLPQEASGRVSEATYGPLWFLRLVWLPAAPGFPC